MLKILSCVLVNFTHTCCFLQFFREDFVQFHPTPLNDLPLDFRGGFFMLDQQFALKLTLFQFMQFLQENTAA